MHVNTTTVFNIVLRLWAHRDASVKKKKLTFELESRELPGRDKTQNKEWGCYNVLAGRACRTLQ